MRIKTKVTDMVERSGSAQDTYFGEWIWPKNILKWSPRAHRYQEEGQLIGGAMTSRILIRMKSVIDRKKGFSNTEI